MATINAVSSTFSSTAFISPDGEYQIQKVFDRTAAETRSKIASPIRQIAYKAATLIEWGMGERRVRETIEGYVAQLVLQERIVRECELPFAGEPGQVYAVKEGKKYLCEGADFGSLMGRDYLNLCIAELKSPIRTPRLIAVVKKGETDIVVTAKIATAGELLLSSDDLTLYSEYMGPSAQSDVESKELRKLVQHARYRELSPEDVVVAADKTIYLANTQFKRFAFQGPPMSVIHGKK